MKIQIADIPDDGLHLDVSESLTSDEFTLLSPVTGEFELQKSGAEVIVTGSAGAEVELQCGRCLKIFRRSLEFPVEVVYHPIGELGNDRHELHGDEMDMGFYSDDEIDIGELVREQLLLNVQMKPLCSEDCKGLCAVCGSDLNVAQCGCATKSVDPRLEVLRNFFEKRKE